MAESVSALWHLSLANIKLVREGRGESSLRMSCQEKRHVRLWQLYKRRRGATQTKPASAAPLFAFLLQCSSSTFSLTPGKSTSSSIPYTEPFLSRESNSMPSSKERSQEDTSSRGHAHSWLRAQWSGRCCAPPSPCFQRGWHLSLEVCRKLKISFRLLVKM